jgi:carbon storage regulator CsrA
MLLLQRRRGQSVVIGRHAEIKVKIIEEKDGNITLGIEAPKAVSIDREEMYKKRMTEFSLSQNFSEMKNN